MAREGELNHYQKYMKQNSNTVDEYCTEIKKGTC